jgi:hypothetical protein
MQVSRAVLATSLILLCAGRASDAAESSFDDIEILAVQPRDAEVKPVIVGLPPPATVVSAAKERRDKAAGQSQTASPMPIQQPPSLAPQGSSGL